MKKTLILMAAASAFVLTGCTETDLSGDTSLAKGSAPSAIQFSAKTRNAGATRTGTKGAIAAITDLKSSTEGFAVFAFNTGTTAWTSGASFAPNFMYNEQVTWNSTTNKWEYAPIKYWPNGIDAANNPNSPSNSAEQEASNIQKLSFFAYAPYVGVTASTGAVATGTADATNGYNIWGITALTGNTNTGNPQVTYNFYKVSDTYSFLTSNNVDLLWGTRTTASYTETDNDPSAKDATGAYQDEDGNYYNTDLTKQVVDETVDFNFKHALAKFGGTVSSIKAVVDVDGNGVGSTGFGSLDEMSNVTIQSITIKNATAAAGKIGVGGVFDIVTGKWTTTTKNTAEIAAGAAYSLTLNAGDEKLNNEVMKAADQAAYTSGTNTWSPAGVTTTAKNVYSTATEDDAFYLIPSIADQVLTVTVTYQVSTFDENINDNYVRTNQTITNNVTLPELEPNKLYTLVLHLGLTSVKFSAEVANWDEVTGDDVEEEVWLPSNVVETTTSTEIAVIGTHATTVTATASATSYTINLTGVENSSDVTVAVTGDGFSADASVTADGSGNATITVTLPTNSTNATKTGVVTLTGTDNSDAAFSETVTINQLGIQ